jgi:hypothetical protein
MADTERAEFPDRAHPLRTLDEDAQRQVVERIQQAKEGPKRKHPRMHSTRRTDENNRVVLTFNLGEYAPMGEHPKVSDALIGKELGVSQTTANKLVHHPELLDPVQTRMLCDVLGVTLDWLRGWTEFNAYGKYETPDVVVAMYELLGNEDKEHVCYLLAKLLGEERTKKLKRRIRDIQDHEWLERHPDTQETEEALDSLNSMFNDIAQSLMDAVQTSMATCWGSFTESLRAMYSDEEWAQMDRTAKELEANGYDTDSLTLKQLAALARGDSVET